MNQLTRDWQLARARALELLTLAAFNEADHPRDEHGRWTDGGGGYDEPASAREADVGTGSEKSKGDCMSAAYKWIKQNTNGTLVHGYVTSDGKRFPHAWGEEGRNVHEVSNGQKMVVPKADYYLQFEVDTTNPQEYARYSYVEALKKSVQTGHYGPWDINDKTYDASVVGTVPTTASVPHERQQKYFDAIEDAPTNEGIEAAEDNWRGGVGDFGDPQAAIDIQAMGGYFEYRSHLEEAAREHFGDQFPVYRLMSTEQLADWRNGADLDPMATTLDPQFAQKFQNFAGFKDDDKTDRVMVSFMATPESIVMRGAREESEIVIDPNQISADTVREIEPPQEAEPEAVHPGPGYSKEARLIGGVIHTDNVYDAARALHEDRDVELTQPRGVSVLIDKLGEISKDMIEKGEKAPTFNLCRVTLKGTSLFCADSQGIPRVEMPQLKAGTEDAFRQHLIDKGYAIDREDQYASHLRATQNELNGAKVAAIASQIRAGNESYRDNPIFVSNDDYILDGHHRWAAEVGLDATDNKLGNDLRMSIWRVNATITQLLHEAEVFTEGKGKVSADESARRKKAWLAAKTQALALLKRFDPSQLRDEWGRWTDGGGGDDSAAGASERVSTTVPSAAKQAFDPHQLKELSPSYKTFKHALTNPKFAAGVDKLMDRYGATFMRLPKVATVAQRAEAFVEHARANITALYDAQNPALRGRSATWYRGANKIAHDLADQYGVSPRAVAGVMASLSPQRDWDQNVELAKRVLDIAVANGKIPIDGTKAAKTKSAMLKYAQQQLDDAAKIEAKLPENPDPKDFAVRGQLLKIENRREMAEDITELANNFEGKTLSQIKGRAQQAIILRFFDEGNADPNRSYAIWNPEGTPSGEVAMAGKGDKMKPRQAGWGAFPMTGNALSILADDSLPNISAMLGDNHKIRNFYNNIISPDYGRDITIDTHAVAAALMMPLGGGASEVKEGLGMSGPKNAETGLKALYALYTEAYRRASEDAGILPREMQSTTWEALRGLFSPEEKRDVKLEASVSNIWSRYKQGKIDLAEAQKEILARGIKPPRWAK